MFLAFIITTAILLLMWCMPFYVCFCHAGEALFFVGALTSLYIIFWSYASIMYFGYHVDILPLIWNYTECVSCCKP
jgi:hypothetical protein